MNNPLDQHRIELYDRQGFLFPVPILTVAEAQSYRSILDDLESLNGGTLKRFDMAHLFFPWAYQLATHERVLDAVASILGDDLLIDGTLVLCKYPNDPSYVSWHQDSVYSEWHLTPSISAWIALSTSDAQRGCMRVIAGSHEGGLLEHEELQDDDNLLRRGERIRAAVDESTAVDIELRPGEMSLHHCNIIHGSNANRSVDKRIGFIVRFVTSRIERKGRPLMKVRGSADCRHLELAERPTESDQMKCFESWKEFTRRRHLPT
jgi:ectoine hydroxylase-related dioxygenase (phytanoyl-CoA dioxygenase family)